MRLKAKYLYITMALVFIIVLIMFLPVAPSPSDAEVLKAEAPNTKTITTIGRYLTHVEPDMAKINIGVISENEEVKAAQEENTKIMNLIFENVKFNGIKKDKIKTISYTIYPKSIWDREEEKSVVIGYIVDSTIELEIEEISKIGKIIDDVVSLGGNKINGISFGIKDQSKFYNEALRFAVEDAKNKAISIGKGIDAKDIKEIKIMEDYTGYSPIMYDYGSIRANGMMESTTPIAEGQVPIEASVTVDFEFKN